MFYNELEPDNESSMPGTPGVPVLEEEEGGLQPKRPPKEKETEKEAQYLRISGMCSSMRTRRKVDLSFMKVREARVYHAEGSRTTRMYGSSRGSPRETG